MSKTVVLYETKDPDASLVTHIAIQTETTPPYVWETYSLYAFRGRTQLPNLPDDLVVLPIKQAKKLFDFKRGNLAQLVTRT